MKTLSALSRLALFLTVFLGCSGLTAYNGPERFEPFISVSDQMILDHRDPNHPHWTHVRMAEVTNPSYAPTHVYVTCQGSMFDELLPSRTTQQFVLNKGDTVCSVSYGVHLEHLPGK